MPDDRRRAGQRRTRLWTDHRIHPAGVRHDLRLHDLHRHAGLRYRVAGVGDGLGRAGGKRRALHYFHHSRHRLHRLVWHPVGRVRQRLRLDGREHAGLRIGQPHRRDDLFAGLGRDHAADGLPGLQGAQVAQLHRRSRAGGGVPVRHHCQHGAQRRRCGAHRL